MGMTDGVQQGGFAVVDMAHHHNHRRSGLQVLFVIGAVVDEFFLDGDDDFVLHLGAEFLGHKAGSVKVHALGHIGHDAQLHQLLDHIGSGLFQPYSQLTHIDLIGDEHFQLHFLGLFLHLQAAQALLLLLALLVAHKAPAIGLALDLLLALGGVVDLLGPLGNQLIHPLIVFGKVHRVATGVHTGGAGAFWVRYSKITSSSGSFRAWALLLGA